MARLLYERYGGVGVIFNLLLRYKIKGKYAEKTQNKP